jgi:alpha-galactosidase
MDNGEAGMRKFMNRGKLGRAFLALVCALIHPACQAEPLLARTPPMGWSSWNHFAEKIDDKHIRLMADALVSSGMREAGYLYVNIDDSWQGKRDNQGNIHPNERFPDMKALADYVHSKGLRIGLYSSPGPTTCANYEGSFGHEEQDAWTYTDWGIDYLKYDLCGLHDLMDKEHSREGHDRMMIESYRKMHEALKKTGRPIVFSICQYGMNRVWEWGESVGGNLWRTTGDIGDNYTRMAEIGFGQAGLSKYAGPGHWNDPDMLEIGNGGMKHHEYVTHMTLWAILAAPLIAGNDLAHMDAATLAILTNREVIAINQDAKGIQGERVWAEGPLEVWVKPLADGSKAVGIFDRSEGWMEPVEIKVDFRKIGIHVPVSSRDVWAEKDLGLLESYSAILPVHSCVLLRVKEGP